MIVVREANRDDAPEISRIFRACYGKDYAYPQFYDLELLTKMIYTDDTVILVAEDEDTGELLGTASVICQVGANSDLTGEFGRLAVDPAKRNLGVGKLLMHERLNRIRERLEVGMMDARVVHPYTLKIAEKSGFHPVGFEPLKMLISGRESIALMIRYFGQALSLRNNHPRIIPEVYPVACLAFENCGIKYDAIVDEFSSSYPMIEGYELEELTSEGYSSLLRIQRGRVSNREIFGPLRLHYGVFKHKATQSRYLIAKEDGRVVGAVGFTFDEIEKASRIFELISLNDDVIRFLLTNLERHLREDYKAEFVEIDVSAYAPRMQRTLIELNFVPVAYLPALVFHDVERLDAVRMARINVPLALGEIHLSQKVKKIAGVVMKAFRQKDIVPEVLDALEMMDLLKGCSKEQAHRLACLCSVRQLEEGELLFEKDEDAIEMYVILTGEIEVYMSHSEEPIASVKAGECLGEISFLTRKKHSASAIASKHTRVAVLTNDELNQLVRQRPDIGLLLYRNLAHGLGEKLQRQDLVVSEKKES